MKGLTTGSQVQIFGLCRDWYCCCYFFAGVGGRARVHLPSWHTRSHQELVPWGGELYELDVSSRRVCFVLV